jgi:hypothetical protein
MMQSNIANPENGDAQISSEMAFFLNLYGRVRCITLQETQFYSLHLTSRSVHVVLGDLLSFPLFVIVSLSFQCTGLLSMIK